MSAETTAAEASGSTAAPSEGLRSGSAGFPPYDQETISKVVSRVEVVSVDLAGSYFWRKDEDAFPTDDIQTTPEFGVDPGWWLSESGGSLACVIGFTTLFDEEDPPYELRARYRITYRLDPGDPLTDDELAMFTSWNAVFNTWSYWREFVGSTLSRAQLPAVTVPVIRVPGWDKNIESQQR